MAADRSQHPIVHFVGSIPLPDTETVFRTLAGGGAVSAPPARRRDRHPQDLDPLSPGRAGREPGDRGRDGRAAVQIRAMGRQGAARNPAPAPQARRQARSRHVQDRLCRHGDRVLGVFDRLQKAGVIPAAGQVPGLAPDADRADLQQHGAGRPAGAAAGADRSISSARSRRSPRRSPTTASRCNGTCARRCWPGKAITKRARSISAPRRSRC